MDRTIEDNLRFFAAGKRIMVKDIKTKNPINPYALVNSSLLTNRIAPIRMTTKEKEAIKLKRNTGFRLSPSPSGTPGVSKFIRYSDNLILV